MEKGRHHFVPRFYLTAFASAPRRINVFHLPTRRAIRDASLRDQCYRHGFYGRSAELENTLGALEARIAPALRQIANGHNPPAIDSREHSLLFTFVALQLLRTRAIATRVNQSVDKFVKKAVDGDTRFEGIDLNAVKIGMKDPVLALLAMLPDILEGISDLKVHLVIAGEKQAFITSDNPVFRYNLYCEGAKDVGVTGALNRGLQIFVPLTPKLLLLLYDGWVYKVGTRPFQVTQNPSDDDVDQLNALQVVGADTSLYCSTCPSIDSITTMVEGNIGCRLQNSMQVLEFVEEGNDLSSLLLTFERTPNVRLRLSFASLRRQARRLEFKDRLHTFRRDISGPSQTVQPQGGAKRVQVYRRRD